MININNNFLLDINRLNINFLARDGIVLATENKSSILYEDDHKVEKISDHIGCVYGGMGSDYR